jgi:hypothetical protein
MPSKEVALTSQESEALSLFDSYGGEVEVLEEELGEPVEWEETPVLVLTSRGVRKEIDFPEANPPYKANLYSFDDARTGVRRSIWGTYQIDGAMESDSIGDTYLFSWKGKRGKGAQQVNVFEIKVRRA